MNAGELKKLSIMPPIWYTQNSAFICALGMFKKYFEYVIFFYGDVNPNFPKMWLNIALILASVCFLEVVRSWTCLLVWCFHFPTLVIGRISLAE